MTRALLAGAALALAVVPASARAQTVAIDPSTKAQAIDGFGTCLSGDEGQQAWFQDLYYGDLGASILRVDLTPSFKAPYSEFAYNSPWFHNSPALPGPDGNNVRTYTSASDYTRAWAGRSAKIAVMGEDIAANVALFDFDAQAPKTQGAMAQAGLARRAALGDFKLYGSLWSPPPWVKISSGHSISGQSGILPVNGTPWPFIWGGNFAGGRLDVSGTPLAALGNTSALTQFARSLAAWLRGFQDKFGVQFWGISIQNEVNFEEFYNSCSYPLSSQYLAALKAARAELDKYPDLAPIRILGPEDLLGGDGWGLWQYGGGSDVTHKNLQYLKEIAADPDAAQAIHGFAIHGYAPDGMSSAGASAKPWDWWAHGWTSAPAAGLPTSVKGFTTYGKASWMTETSGEKTAWLAPATGFPADGAFSIALKIHQALTSGRESAWLYWQLTDGKAAAEQTLTDATLRASAPKLAAARHFFRYIRPGAQRIGATVAGAADLYASAYLHEASGALTVVLVNAAATDRTATVQVPVALSLSALDAYTSKKDSSWVKGSAALAAGSAAVPVPGYGVVTLVGTPPGPPAHDAGTAAPDAAAAPGGPDASTPTADAGAPAADASSPEGPQVASGCACSTAAGPLLAGALALVALARRRRLG